MKHAMGCILAAYDEEDRRRQMACDFGCCIRSGHSGFSARDSARLIVMCGGAELRVPS